MADSADKRQDFLWIVQMIMDRYSDSIQGWPGIAGDAVAASHRLPAKLTAREAAIEFCAFWIEPFRGAGVERTCPSWMSSLSDPVYTANRV
jgi:hypothetical protein